MLWVDYGSCIVGNASTKLVSSATELSTDPHSSKARIELLDSVNGILQGTTTVLDVFDESEMYCFLIVV